MEFVLEQQNAAIDAIIADRTATHWGNSPEFHALIEPVTQLGGDSLRVPDLKTLVKMVRIIGESDDEQSHRLFLLLETYCAVTEPSVVAEVLGRFTLEGGEPYPSMSAGESGYLSSVFEYKPELARKGNMVRRLWELVKSRAGDIDQLTIKWIVLHMGMRKEVEREEARRKGQSAGARNSAEPSCTHRCHSIIYMLHCGPLSDQGLVLLHEEEALNALARISEGADPKALGNQQLMLHNLLDRFFSWMENKENQENIDRLKPRIASLTKIPELLYFAMDAILRYLDGRWVRSDGDESSRAKPTPPSLMESNRKREPMHYMSSTEQAGDPLGFHESKNSIKGKSLREKEVVRTRGRGRIVQEFEIGDLVTQCMDGHEAETIERLLRSLFMHIGLRVDTAMISATPAVMKHAAQQRDKILLRLISENMVYRRIMVGTMEQGLGSVAAICLPVLQGMLRCSIAHWSTCKNTTPKAYPKELQEATWLAQLAEQTALIPYPISQAAVLFPLIQSKDIGVLLEQCYYVLLVRNAEILQPPQPQQQQHQHRLEARQDDPELQLIRQLIFKHAQRTVHLMPLFATQLPSSAAE